MIYDSDMLPKQHRLELRSIPDFFRTSKKIQTSFFRIFIKHSKGSSQLAVIVPKTKQLNAVKRNLLKRKIKAAALPLIEEKTDLQMAIVVYDKTLALSVEEIKKIIEEKIN